MEKHLSSEMGYLFKEVVSRRNPELVEAVDQIESGFLTSTFKQSLIDILTDELRSTGLRPESEPTGRGLMLEDLLDCLKKR